MNASSWVSVWPPPRWAMPLRIERASTSWRQISSGSSTIEDSAVAIRDLPLAVLASPLRPWAKYRTL